MPLRRSRTRNARRPNGAPTDAELVEGILRASEAHFSELYNRYFQRIYNFTYVRVRNRADVEEIVQETFTAVFRSINAFRGDSTLLTWIFGIARNTINSHARKARNENERLGLIGPELLRPICSLSSCTPEEQLTLRRYVDAIQERLSSVAAWQLDVFRLRYVENLPIREIAQRTDRSDDAIRSSLYRVKRAMLEVVESRRGKQPPREGFSAA